MRKILAGFLATSMVVSMSTMISAATTYAAASVTGTLPSTTPFAISAPTVTDPGDIDSSSATTVSPSGAKWNVDLTVKSATVTLNTGIAFDIAINETKAIEGGAFTNGASGAVPTAAAMTNVTDVQIESVVKGKSYPFDTVIQGAHYTGKLTVAGGKATVLFDQKTELPAAAVGVSPTISFALESGKAITTTAKMAYTQDTTSAPITGAAITMTPLAAAVTATPATSGTSISKGSGDELIENEKTGTFENVRVSDVIKSYGDGTPIPLTEDPIGVDEALNTQGGVQSGKTLYFLIRDDGPVAKLGEDKFWKLKISKGDNSKYVTAVSDVTKIFGKDLYNANTGKPELDTGADKKRHRYIKVELKEIYTDDEYKITLDMTLRAQSAAVDAGIATEGSEIKIKDFSFWMKNIVKDADNDWEVGIGGLMLNPVTNDWNNVTYFDEEGDVAFMKFFGDSDTGKFYAKLSTKWAHEDYAAYFNDQDAFYFEFTGSPNLSSTSRADLHIYNPFVDEDGTETIDPSTATVYQVVDGDLIDVTDSFTYGEGENGDNAFITRTRFLGSYIICEKPVEEAAGDADIDDLMPDDLEVPEDVTPDAGNNGGAKQPANTGRYI